MFFKKNDKNKKIFQLSDDAINFIKDYLLKECKVSERIDMDMFEEFIDMALDWETQMVDENGRDKIDDYPNKKRNEMADRFVSEVSAKLSSGLWLPDIDDLNKKLGLL